MQVQISMGNQEGYGVHGPFLVRLSMIYKTIIELADSTSRDGPDMHIIGASLSESHTYQYYKKNHIPMYVCGVTASTCSSHKCMHATCTKSKWVTHGTCVK